MAIGVLVEAFIPGGTAGGGTGSASAVGGNSPPKNEKDFKEWLKNKLKALASLPEKFEAKAAGSIVWHHWGDHQLDS